MQNLDLILEDLITSMLSSITPFLTTITLSNGTKIGSLNNDIDIIFEDGNSIQKASKEWRDKFELKKIETGDGNERYALTDDLKYLVNTWNLKKQKGEVDIILVSLSQARAIERETGLAIYKGSGFKCPVWEKGCASVTKFII